MLFQCSEVTEGNQLSALEDSANTNLRTFPLTDTASKGEDCMVAWVGEGVFSFGVFGNIIGIKGTFEL